MDFLNSSDQNLTSEELLNRMPSKILVSFILSGLALMTTTINSLVIAAIIIVTWKLHHPANYLICSLAVTDFLVAVLVMPFSIVYIVRESWIMGQVVCDIWLSDWHYMLYMFHLASLCYSFGSVPGNHWCCWVCQEKDSQACWHYDHHSLDYIYFYLYASSILEAPEN